MFLLYPNTIKCFVMYSPYFQEILHKNNKLWEKLAHAALNNVYITYCTSFSWQQIYTKHKMDMHSSTWIDKTQVWISTVAMLLMWNFQITGYQLIYISIMVSEGNSVTSNTVNVLIRILRSTMSIRLSEPFASTAFAKHAFRCSAPATWNSLPRTVTDNDSLGTFKSRLKTFLFSLAFNWHWHYPASASEVTT